MTVQLVLLVSIEWSDFQMMWDKDDYDGIETIRLPPHLVWLPDVVLFNNADGGYEVSFYSNVVVDSTGKMLWVPPAIYKSACTMDVEHFPFDSQQCVMRFGSWTYDSDEVYLVEKVKGITLGDFNPSSIWDITDCSSELIHNGSQIVYTVILRRKPLFYLVLLITPTVVMAVITAAVFYLPSASGEKVTLVISILLSLVVFILLISKLLPPTESKIPLLARYLLLTFTLNGFAVFTTILIINIFFRRPAIYVMPKWFKAIFLVVLPRMLLMRRPKRRTHPEDLSDEIAGIDHLGTIEAVLYSERDALQPSSEPMPTLQLSFDRDNRSYITPSSFVPNFPTSSPATSGEKRRRFRTTGKRHRPRVAFQDTGRPNPNKPQMLKLSELLGSPDGKPLQHHPRCIHARNQARHRPQLRNGSAFARPGESEETTSFHNMAVNFEEEQLLPPPRYGQTLRPFDQPHYQIPTRNTSSHINRSSISGSATDVDSSSSRTVHFDQNYVGGSAENIRDPNGQHAGRRNKRSSPNPRLLLDPPLHVFPELRHMQLHPVDMPGDVSDSSDTGLGAHPNRLPRLVDDHVRTVSPREGIRRSASERRSDLVKLNKFQRTGQNGRADADKNDENGIYSTEVIDAPLNVPMTEHAFTSLLSVDFITKHFQRRDKNRRTREDWIYASMVVDRLMLYIFTGATIGSALGVMFTAPDILTSVNQADVIARLNARYGWF